jgi:hypothetical protein
VGKRMVLMPIIGSRRLGVAPIQILHSCKPHDTDATTRCILPLRPPTPRFVAVATHARAGAALTRQEAPQRGQQGGGTGLSWRRGPSVLIDALEDGPVAVQMQRATRTLRCERKTPRHHRIRPYRCEPRAAAARNSKGGNMSRLRTWTIRRRRVRTTGVFERPLVDQHFHRRPRLPGHHQSLP